MIEFQRGEPIVVGLRVLSGDPAGYDLAATMKRSSGSIVPPRSGAVAATPSVTFVPAAGDVAPHWLLTVAPADSAALAPGTYAMDAALSVGGARVDITAPIFIRLAESMSAP